ncbi:MAG: complex I NDUFA9 subunit family protein [Chloroflexi bacterium]|nr:complex I NDUFA9 subunit family protein [Chloroflexota bacterium]
MILVTGATGFVGRGLVQALAARGKRVRALVHRPGREHLLAGEGVEVHIGDVTDPSSLRSAMEGVETVVHLVAVIRERGGATFEGVNHQGTGNVAQAAREAGVGCLVHLSAVGAVDDHRFPYLRSKWRAEREVVESGVPYTILRASIQFGEGDEFINTLAGAVKAFPIVPVAGDGNALFLPISVAEVAECIAQAVDRDELRGRVIEIGGPEHLSYNQILDTIARTYNIRRIKAHLPLVVMRRIVWLMERTLPSPPATGHQLDMLAIDNIAELDTVERTFGFKPRRLEGNIDYIRSISRWEALRIALGFMPKRVRDH